MKLKIFAVKDMAVDAFGQPFFTNAVGGAIRSFTDETNRDGAAFNAHPGDYDLYELGEYDDESGAIVSIPPRMLVRGKEVVVKSA